jgi:hypothetical protein
MLMILSGCQVFKGNWRYTAEVSARFHIERAEPPQQVQPLVIEE